MSARGRRLRAPVIAGNWKMHKGPTETRAFLRDFAERHARDDAGTILFFPPAISFLAAVETVGGRDDLLLGVQNVHWEAAGAFTGEISAPMARDAGAAVALTGHSERRHVFGETDDDVRRKTAAALDSGLAVVACVGETLEERRGGRLEEVLLRQLAAILDAAAGRSDADLALAYEPVWAIGTGETATPDDASAAHRLLRDRLRERLSDDRAGQIPILYGGSVKPDNAVDLLAADGVDGVLVGGASLDPASFAAIAAAARR